MTLHALEDIDDAVDVTREFLFPIDRTTWLKLALVVFFIGGPGANFNTFQWTGGDGGGEMTPGDLGPETIALVLGVVGVVLVVGLAFAFVGSVLEFVFVESLRTREVEVRRYWGAHWRKGLWLFGFRLVLGLFVVGSVVLLALPFLLPFFDAGVGGGAAIGFFLLLLPLFLVLAIVVGLINGFTTVFVVPIMLLEDCGVRAGWRRLWPTITTQWTQYLAYVVASFFLSIIGGILAAIVILVLALALLIPFGILFALGFGLFLVSEPLGIATFVVVGLVYAFAVLVVVALVQVPVQTYLRYYALLVLGDVDPALDLIPSQRAEVRGDSDTVA